MLIIRIELEPTDGTGAREVERILVWETRRSGEVSAFAYGRRLDGAIGELEHRRQEGPVQLARSVLAAMK